MTDPSLLVELAKIQAKLDLLLTGNQDHEARLRVLERFRWQAAGACAVAFALAGFVTSRL